MQNSGKPKALLVLSIFLSVIFPSSPVSATGNTSLLATPHYVAVAPTISKDPAVTGTPTAGSVLTVSIGTWKNAKTYLYKWYSCTTSIAATATKKNAACTQITGALASKFTLTESQAGKFIVASVQGMNGKTAGPTKFSKSTAVVKSRKPEIGATKPIVSISNGSFTSINGLAVGATASVSNGTWSNSPTAYTYKWYACNSAVAAAVTAVPGTCSLLSASASSLVITPDVVGKFITAVVTAINAAGSNSYIPASSTAVRDLTPVNVVAPEISGSVWSGTSMTLTPGDWSNAPSLSFQWYRCDQFATQITSDFKAAHCEDSPVSSVSSYTTGISDVGKYIAGQVSAQTISGSVSAWTATTSQIAGFNGVGETPTISTGTTDAPIVGQSISVTQGSQAVVGTDLVPTYTFEIIHCDSDSPTLVNGAYQGCETQSGQDDSAWTYTFSNRDSMTYVFAKVTAHLKDANDVEVASNSKLSNPIGPIDGVRNTLAPTVAGVPLNGQIFTATEGRWTSISTLDSASYQWYACSSPVAASSTTLADGCTPLDWQTSNTYSAWGDPSYQQYLLVGVTHRISDAIYTTVYSASSAKIEGLFDVSLESSDRQNVDEWISPNLNTHNSWPRTSEEYSWYRCDQSVLSSQSLPDNCQLIDGQSEYRYKVTVDDLGKFVVPKVFTSNTYGSATLHGSSLLRIGGPTDDYTRYQSNPFVNDSIAASPGQLILDYGNPLSYQWYDCTTYTNIITDTVPATCSAISDATTDSYTPIPLQSGHYLVYSVATHDGDGNLHTLFSSMSREILYSPTITGTYEIGNTLSVSINRPYENFAHDFNGVSAYQWMDCPYVDSTSDCVAIDGATSSTYELKASDAGYSIGVQLTFRHVIDPAFIDGPNWFAGSGRVPGIAGVAYRGSIYSVNDSFANSNVTAPTTTIEWIAKPAPQVTYQWYVCGMEMTYSDINSLPDNCSQIDNATDSTFTARAQDIQTGDTPNRYVVKITGTNEHGSYSYYLANYYEVHGVSEMVTPGSLDTTSPTSGNLITFTNGTWNYASHYWPFHKFQNWYLCPANTVTNTDVLSDVCGPAVSTETTYLPNDNDLGKVVIVEYGWNFNYESKSYRTAETNAISGLHVTDNLGYAGAYVIGSSISVDGGTWAGYPAVTGTTYSWLRCTTPTGFSSTAPTDCTAIPNANGNSYAITDADYGYYLTYVSHVATVDGTFEFWNAAYQATVPGYINVSSDTQLATAASHPVAGTNYAMTVGAASGIPADITESKYWLRCTNAIRTSGSGSSVPDGCATIDGQNGLSYTATADDFGAYILPVESWTSSDSGVFAQYSWGVSGNQIEGFHELTEAPSISGDVSMGSTLTVSNGAWNAIPATSSNGYKWYRCDSNTGDLSGTLPADCSLIANETTNSYTISGYDTTKYLFAEVSATNTHDTKSARTGFTSLITGAPFLASEQTVGQYAVGKTATFNASGSYIGFDSSRTPETTWYQCANQPTGDTSSLDVSGCNRYYSPQRQLSMRNSYDCAITADQHVKCANGGPLTEVSGISNAVSVSSFAYLNDAFGCAVLSTGQIKCWGDNQRGELGLGNSNAAPATPQPVVGITNAISVTTMQQSVCALLSTGLVKCWGDNYWGQTGQATTFDARTFTPSSVALGTGLTATSLVSGTSHTCALISDGTVKCWGIGLSGQTGYIAAAHPAASTVVGVSNAIQITTSDDVSCALINGGTAKCWGNNHNAALGTGSASDVFITTAVDVTGITDAIEIQTGGVDTCVVLATSDVKCWGYNRVYLQLGGDVTFGLHTEKVTIGLGADIPSLYLTATSTCVLYRTQSMGCFGSVRNSGFDGIHVQDSAALLPVNSGKWIALKYTTWNEFGATTSYFKHLVAP